MTTDIAFLHTAAVHITTFEQLLLQVEPALSATHQVREDLLAQARELGADDAGLVSRVQQAMTDAAAGGAAWVVCTCSTIGGAAERTPTQGRFGVMRIDRAMADRAVMLGPRILLVAALQSTLAPTTQLIAESAAALGRSVEVRPLWVQGAWAHFEQGDSAAYVLAVAAAVVAAVGSASGAKGRDPAQSAPGGADVVVLAQASMAPAVQSLQHLGIEVLASPALGVHAIAERLRGRRARS